MSLAEEFDMIGHAGPKKRRPKAPVDTSALKRAIDFDTSTRTEAIRTRDAARSDSSSVASSAQLEAGNLGYSKPEAKAHFAQARALGEKARAADSTIAASAAKIGANTAALNKARKGGKP